jgi:hypothetical protein
MRRAFLSHRNRTERQGAQQELAAPGHGRERTTVFAKGVVVVAARVPRKTPGFTFAPVGGGM